MQRTLNRCRGIAVSVFGCNDNECFGVADLPPQAARRSTLFPGLRQVTSASILVKSSADSD